MEHFIFTNARIVLPDTILDDHYLSVKNGVIESIGKGTPDREQLNSCTTVDCGGQYLSPGFIDIHCHGGGGADFMDGTWKISSPLPGHILSTGPPGSVPPH